ncbi:hypothetical protein ACP70R_048539 [Stipagrostis hirtigluma subsp. patula]
MAAARAYWDKDVTKIFLDLCIAEKEKMNFNYKKGLNKVGWNNVYRNFRQQTGRTYSSKQLQNKFHSLKRIYKLWRKLKNTTGAGWDNTTGIIVGDDDWWRARIAENPDAEHLKGKPLAHEEELANLFGTMMDIEEGDMLCAGGIGDRTPSGGSEDNLAPQSEDNVGRCSGVRVQRAGKEQVVDSPPPKKSKSMEYYVQCISESMLERNRNESNALKQEQKELQELLQLVEDDGVEQGTELHFIATELLRSATRRAAFRMIRLPEHRISWLRWTWENGKRK